jgi:hypothetical protein
MSHFIGLVFLRPSDDLEEVLAPFNEQDEAFMEFVDKTDEVKEKWEKIPETCPSEGTFTEEIDRTDMVNEIWDEAEDVFPPEKEDALWRPYTKDKYPTPADIAKDKGYKVVPDETKRDGVRFVQEYEAKWEYEPSKEKYPTIDKLAKDYFGYRKVNGKYGYMSNPNAKYDWYSEGGRWNGYLTNKEGNTTNCELLTEVDWDKTDTPFCFVNDNGEWIERGQMGWFAMVANEKKKETWVEEFKSYVQSLLNDKEASEIEVYAIDYHI